MPNQHKARSTATGFRAGWAVLEVGLCSREHAEWTILKQISTPAERAFSCWQCVTSLSACMRFVDERGRCYFVGDVAHDV